MLRCFFVMIYTHVYRTFVGISRKKVLFLQFHHQIYSCDMKSFTDVQCCRHMGYLLDLGSSQPVRGPVEAQAPPEAMVPVDPVAHKVNWINWVQPGQLGPQVYRPPVPTHST